MLQCPRCQAGLETVLYENVEIETCPVCHGEWLDAGELNHIVETVEKTFTPEEIGTLDALNRNVFKISQGGDQRLNCPKCFGQKLTPFNYASSSGIILDKCPGCGGIWFDRNELERVQALVEGWTGYLRQDPPRYGGILAKVEARSAAPSKAPAMLPRFSIFAAVLRVFR